LERRKTTRLIGVSFATDTLIRFRETIAALWFLFMMQSFILPIMFTTVVMFTLLINWEKKWNIRKTQFG